MSKTMRIMRCNADWWTLDAELPWTIFSARTKEECIAEAERRGVPYEVVPETGVTLADVLRPEC